MPDPVLELLIDRIATPTGEGVTSPLTFTRQRRCTSVVSKRTNVLSPRILRLTKVGAP